uniref:CWH43-like N-terminal domain-containing protein n=1 Tax=Rhodnius prolixus TaxID=13249 RepID=T1HV13_RHOPR
MPEVDNNIFINMRYIWSVLNQHVYPLFPNVSDTGTLPPESCLFSLMLNLTAALILFSVYIRHKEIIEVFRAKKLADTLPFSAMFNTVTTIVGLLTCVGLDLMANFQETNVLVVHVMITNMVTGDLAFREFSEAHTNSSKILIWTPDLPGWKWHV